METIKNSWKGEERLWKVFWLYNILLGGLLLAIFEMVPETYEISLLVFALFLLAWAIWLLVSLWRCAFNASWRGWGYIVRVLVVLSITYPLLILLGVIPVDETAAV